MKSKLTTLAQQLASDRKARIKLIIDEVKGTGLHLTLSDKGASKPFKNIKDGRLYSYEELSSCTETVYLSDEAADELVRILDNYY